MGDLIKFPTHKIKPNSKPERPPLSEEEARLIKEEKFVEQITESLILDIIHVLQENVVETKTDVFLRDLAIVIESIKGLLKETLVEVIQCKIFPILLPKFTYSKMVEKLPILITITL